MSILHATNASSLLSSIEPTPQGLMQFAAHHSFLLMSRPSFQEGRILLLDSPEHRTCQQYFCFTWHQLLRPLLLPWGWLLVQPTLGPGSCNVRTREHRTQQTRLIHLRKRCLQSSDLLARSRPFHQCLQSHLRGFHGYHLNLLRFSRSQS